MRGEGLGVRGEGEGLGARGERAMGGRGELRLSLKGTGTSVCDVIRTQPMSLGHRPSIGVRCEEI